MHRAPTTRPAARPGVVLTLLATLLVVVGCSDQGPGPTVVPQTSAEVPETTSPPTEPDVATPADPEQETESIEDDGVTQTSSAAPAPEGSGEVSDLVMCSGETFDEAASACPAAEDRVETSALHCSGTITIGQAGEAVVVFARDGEAIQTLEIPLTDDVVGTTVPLDADTSVGELAVPGGLWSCEVSLPDGSVGEVAMQVEGPTPALSQGRACDSEDTLVTENLTHCLTDEAELPAGLAGITCSALLVGVDGEDITVSLVVNGDSTPVGTVTSPLGMIVAHVNIEPVAFGGTTFPPGDYSCVFESGTEASGQHDFMVVE